MKNMKKKSFIFIWKILTCTLFVFLKNWSRSGGCHPCRCTIKYESPQRQKQGYRGRRALRTSALCCTTRRSSIWSWYCLENNRGIVFENNVKKKERPPTGEGEKAKRGDHPSFGWGGNFMPPRRGIEPRSPAWQAGILTDILTRPDSGTAFVPNPSCRWGAAKS